jgi:hypothetical protein
VGTKDLRLGQLRIACPGNAPLDLGGCVGVRRIGRLCEIF